MRSKASLVAALAFALGAAGLALRMFGGHELPAGGFGFAGYQTLPILAYGIVGLIVARRRPDNVIGWLLLGVALWWGADVLLQQVALRHVRAPLPAGDVAVWLSGGLWPLATLGIMLTLFRFPDGSPPGSRWRRVEWVIVTLVLLAAAIDSLTPGPFLATGLANPFGLAMLADLPAALDRGRVFVQPAGVLAFAGLVARFIRSRGVERQQLKWLSLMALAVVPIMPLLSLRPHDRSVQLLMHAAAQSFPILIGVAMLRYRLYDVDVVINRALVYGSLSVVVGATYIALVVAAQTVLRPLTGGSELAVAASTLAVIGMVQPLRRRIQTVVDRRFYRSRYDAARTLDGYTARMRDEVDIDALRHEVLDVIGSTLQPAHASVWLRERAR